MAAPPPTDGYGQVPGQQQQQQQQQQQPFDQPSQPGFPPADVDADASASATVSAPGKKKKRGYAAQAFEVGSGSNSAGLQYGAPPSQQQSPGYGGYPPPEAQQAAVAGYPYSQPYGAAPLPGQPPQMQQQQQQPPALQPPHGAYPAPDQGYPAPGIAAQPAPPGLAAVTQGMDNMQLGQQQHQQQVPQQMQQQHQQLQQPPPAPGAQAARAGPLNQLYTTDLMSQPFSIHELDLPPPPIVLPPNVRWSRNSSFLPPPLLSRLGQLMIPFPPLYRRA